MRFAIAPTQLLHPRLAFLAFLFVFFFPVVGSATVPQLIALACGAAYFLAGTYVIGAARERQWPSVKPNWWMITFIIAVKAFQLGGMVGFDLTPSNIALALIESSAAQKENVAGGLVLNTTLALIFWRNLIGMCTKGMFFRALGLMVLFQVLSLQTGRFLLVSQLGLLTVIHYQICRRKFNGAVLVPVVVALAALFPMLHAVRSGDISGDVDVYSYDYVSAIMAADASPGRNFFDLVDHVNEAGYNYGWFAVIAPLQFMPRAIWADKPTTSLQAVYTNDIYGIDHVDGVTFTFTIFDSYTYFGVPSVAVVSLFWGVVFMFLYNMYRRSRGAYIKIQLALLAVNFFNFCRGNVLDFAAPVVISLLIACVLDWIERAPRWTSSFSAGAEAKLHVGNA